MNTEGMSLLKEEIKLYKLARARDDHKLSYLHLGRAHIISQIHAGYHFYVHLLMLAYAIHRVDMKEILGQIIRILVTIPGHVTGRVPLGNIGWSSVSLTKEEPIPEDLNRLFIK